MEPGDRLHEGQPGLQAILADNTGVSDELLIGMLAEWTSAYGTTSGGAFLAGSGKQGPGAGC